MSNFLKHGLVSLPFGGARLTLTNEVGCLRPEKPAAETKCTFSSTEKRIDRMIFFFQFVTLRLEVKRRTRI